MLADLMGIGPLKMKIIKLQPVHIRVVIMGLPAVDQNGVSGHQTAGCPPVIHMKAAFFDADHENRGKIISSDLVLGDLSTHTFYMSELICPELKLDEVLCFRQAFVGSRYPLEDNAYVLMKYEGGAVGRMWTSAVNAGRVICKTRKCVLRDENKGAATEKYRCCSFFLISMKNISEKYQ